MNAVIISISSQEVNFLLSISTIQNLNEKLHEISKKTDFNLKRHHSLTITLTEIEEILNILTFHLAHSGIDNDGRTNKTGIIIEDLIDLFSKNVYEEQITI